MTIHICPRCGYNTEQKGDLRKHFQRKKICKPILNDIDLSTCYNKLLGNSYVAEFYSNKNKKNTKNDSVNDTVNVNVNDTVNVNELRKKYQCNYCNKLLTSRQGKYAHHRICKFKNQVTENIIHIDKNNKNNNEKSSFIENNKEIKQLIEQAKEEGRKESLYIIGELKSQIEVLLKNQGTNNTHTTNYNIMVNSFGKENLDYISKDDIYNIINDGPVYSIPKLLKYIHFNPEHKENHNVKITNKKQNYAQIFNGIDWEYRDKQDTIENMSDRAYEILNKHYIPGSNKYMDNFKDEYDESSKTVYKRVHKDTELMILNSQKII